MKKSILFAFAAMAAAGAYGAAPQVGTGETNGFKLVWQDLFDGTQLDTENRWNIEVNGDGGGNNELQYYTDRAENVRVGDDGQGNGCLILTARRESYRNKAFTSGRITSMGKTAFTHGKIEAAIKFPTTHKGLWPAFWMMGDDFAQVGWPQCGETDIVEMGHSNGFNGKSDRYFNGACHWGARWDQVGDYARDKTLDYSLQDGEFHLYTCIWDAGFIRMYVDLDKNPSQQPYYEIDITRVDMSDPWVAGNYFHKPNFILFNLAVGGNFPGIHNADGITALNDDNGHEASMYVNYVKVYQKGTDPQETFYSLVPGDQQPVVGIDNVVAGTDAADSVVDVYTTTGVMVRSRVDAATATENLPAGIYIVGNRKVLVK